MARSRPARSQRIVVLAALLSTSVAGCQGPSYAKGGSASPTVSGCAPAAFADLEAARKSFSRSQGPLTAILLDTAWIRLEADPVKAQERYPEYFEGFTTFDATLETQTFTRPTDETYLLEDSTGMSVTTKPVSYKGDFARGLGPKFVSTFRLIFPHAMSKDVRWIKLTRKGPEDGTLSWDFPGGA